MTVNTENARRRNRLLSAAAILIVAALLLAIEYLITVSINRQRADNTAVVLIDRIKGVLESNAQKENALVESLKENYITKARAVAYILDNGPDMEYSLAELARIAELMSIDEIHIFDA